MCLFSQKKSVLRPVMLAEKLHALVTSPRGTIGGSEFKDTTGLVDQMWFGRNNNKPEVLVSAPFMYLHQKYNLQ